MELLHHQTKVLRRSTSITYLIAGLFESKRASSIGSGKECVPRGIAPNGLLSDLLEFLLQIFFSDLMESGGNSQNLCKDISILIISH